MYYPLWRRFSVVVLALATVVSVVLATAVFVERALLANRLLGDAVVDEVERTARWEYDTVVVVGS
jgi:hypothetical protein